MVGSADSVGSVCNESMVGGAGIVVVLSVLVTKNITSHFGIMSVVLVRLEVLVLLVLQYLMYCCSLKKY
jgi:hypothetical protein